MSESLSFVVRPAQENELEELMRMRWQWSIEAGDKPAASIQDFLRESVEWAKKHAGTHFPHLAIAGDDDILGMAWLALTPWVPSMQRVERYSGDLQSCYVKRDFRGLGIGTSLIQAVIETARQQGAEYVNCFWAR